MRPSGGSQDLSDLVPTVSGLPDHILLHGILPFVPTCSLLHLSLTNRHFHSLCISDAAWEPRASSFLQPSAIPDVVAPLDSTILARVLLLRRNMFNATQAIQLERLWEYSPSAYRLACRLIIPMILPLFLSQVLCVALFVVIAAFGFGGSSTRTFAAGVVLWVIFGLSVSFLICLGAWVCVYSKIREKCIRRVVRWADEGRTHLQKPSPSDSRKEGRVVGPAPADPFVPKVVADYEWRQTKYNDVATAGSFGFFGFTAGCALFMVAVVGCLAIQATSGSSAVGRGKYVGSLVGVVVLMVLLDVIGMPIFTIVGCRRARDLSERREAGQKRWPNENLGIMVAIVAYLAVIELVCAIPIVVLAGLYNDGFLGNATVAIALIPMDILAGICVCACCGGTIGMGVLYAGQAWCCPEDDGDEKMERCVSSLASIAIYWCLAPSCLGAVCSLVLVPARLSSLIGGHPFLCFLPAILGGVWVILFVYVVIPGTVWIGAICYARFKKKRVTPIELES